MRDLLRFPSPVNEVAARLVAAGVVVMGVLTLAFQEQWLLIVIAVGFIARVLTGPTLSPLGQLATRVLAPRLPFSARPVPGPPKRFAQGVGAVVTISAAVLSFAFHQPTWAYGLIGLVVVFALAESALGFCVGCQVFALLMRLRIIPERVCIECANITLRRRAAS